MRKILGINDDFAAHILHEINAAGELVATFLAGCSLRDAYKQVEEFTRGALSPTVLQTRDIAALHKAIHALIAKATDVCKYPSELNSSFLANAPNGPTKAWCHLVWCQCRTNEHGVNLLGASRRLARSGKAEARTRSDRRNPSPLLLAASSGNAWVPSRPPSRAAIVDSYAESSPQYSPTSSDTSYECSQSPQQRSTSASSAWRPRPQPAAASPAWRPPPLPPPQPSAQARRPPPSQLAAQARITQSSDRIPSSPQPPPRRTPASSVRDISPSQPPKLT